MMSGDPPVYIVRDDKARESTLPDNISSRVYPDISRQLVFTKVVSKISVHLKHPNGQKLSKFPESLFTLPQRFFRV